MKKALVIQPSISAINLVNESLGELFAVKVGDDYIKGSVLASETFYDLVICHINEQTFETAMTLVNHLKSFDHYANTPIFILSEEKSGSQLSRAFENGCDEYLSFPIESLELKARVRARVRDLVPTNKNYYWAADLRFCLGTLRVVATDDQSTTDLELTPNEFRILFLLSRHVNKTLSRDFILNEVWGQNMHVVARTVDKHICSLRRKLQKRSSYLVSVPNKGYMFHVPGKTQSITSSTILNPAS